MLGKPIVEHQLAGAAVARHSCRIDLRVRLAVGENLPHRRADVRQAPKLQGAAQGDEGLQGVSCLFHSDAILLAILDH